MKSLEGRYFRLIEDMDDTGEVYTAYLAKGHEKLRTRQYNPNGPAQLEVETASSPKPGQVVVHPVDGVGDCAMTARQFTDNYREVEAPQEPVTAPLTHGKEDPAKHKKGKSE